MTSAESDLIIGLENLLPRINDEQQSKTMQEIIDKLLPPKETIPDAESGDGAAAQAPGPADTA